MDEMNQTADCVATHFGFASVGIKDTHAKVGALRTLQKHNTICTNAIIAVTQRGHEGNFPMEECFVLIINEDEVVPCTRVFTKGYSQLRAISLK